MLCLQINLIPGLVFKDELLLRYEHFVGTHTVFKITLWVAMETVQFRITTMDLLFRNILVCLNVASLNHKNVIRDSW